MTLGVLEAVSAAFGEQLNELAGYRSTRLTTQWATGAATAFVESTFGWPASGKFIVAGVPYSYTAKTPTSLTGVTWDDEGTPVVGARETHVVASEVIDFSKTFSVLDQTIQSLFVGTAVGSSLSTVGRNVGVERPPGLEDDDIYRAVIRALAYAPKGTMFAIELALTAFFGAGNFEVWENIPTFRNTVFIRILGGLFLNATASGQAYLTRQEKRPLNTATQQVTITGPLTTVQGVRLANEDKTTSFVADKPSVEIDVRYEGDAGVPVWTFAGTNEPVDVIASAADGGVVRIQDNGVADTTAYFHTARVRPESKAYFELHLRPITIPSSSATAGLQFAFQIRDSLRDLAVGFFDGSGGVEIGFIATSTGSLLAGVATVLDPAVYNTVAIRKRGTGRAQLLVNNAVVQEVNYLDFSGAAGGLNEFRFGCQSTAVTGVEVRVKYASFFAETDTDYWNMRGTSGETTGPVTFDTNSAAVLVADAGKALRTYDAATPKNNGAWVILTRIDADSVTLGGPLQQLAIVESAFPARVRIANNSRAFTYPYDVGKRIDLAEAQTFPNAGSYVIANVLDPVTFTPITGTSVEYSNVVEVVGSAFVTETEIPWRLIPDFDNETPISWEMSESGSVSGNTLILRANPPMNIPGGYVVILQPVYTQVLSAQLLAGPEIVNEFLLGNFTHYPFYLPSNPLGPFVAFLDDLTVAGVIPEVSL